MRRWGKGEIEMVESLMQYNVIQYTAVRNDTTQYLTIHDKQIPVSNSKLQHDTMQHNKVQY